MTSETVNLEELNRILGGMRDELARLSARVQVLEAATVAHPESAQAVAEPSVTPTSTVRPQAPVTQPEPINEELIVVISAAIAAFLGKKPHIRQIRLMGGASWVQQGRATVQASHSLVQHR